ncbi:MAG: YceI family protein [bacterium]|nr:YceI family protein [bacterium]
MKRNITLIAVVALIVMVAAAAVSQTGMRKMFRGNGDNNRNFVVMENNAQLQSTLAKTSSFDISADIRLDSIQDGASLELNVQLGTLSTGNSSYDMEVFSSRFIDWKGASTANFRLLDFTVSRNYALENEKAVPATGRGVLTIGSIIDTVGVDVSIRYLAANDVTLGRLPGDLLHLNGAINFRLSSFGIEIPQEALLRMDDKVKLRFDVYCSTQM